MKHFRAALPMLFSAALSFYLRKIIPVHAFGLGVCCGGAFTMALRDVEKSLVEG